MLHTLNCELRSAHYLIVNPGCNPSGRTGFAHYNSGAAEYEHFARGPAQYVILIILRATLKRNLVLSKASSDCSEIQTKTKWFSPVHLNISFSICRSRDRFNLVRHELDPDTDFNIGQAVSLRLIVGQCNLNLSR